MHTKKELQNACDQLRFALNVYNENPGAWQKNRVAMARERVAMLTRVHMDAMARQAMAKGFGKLGERAAILAGGSAA